MLNVNYELFKGVIAGKKIAVLGLGISNVPAIEFLNGLGAKVCGCDKNTQEKFDKNILDILKKNCQSLYLGDDYLDHLDDFDIIIKSPGIKLSTPQIQKAIADGKTVTSEIEMFMAMCPCKIIGITGSDGKTTTTSLVYEMLKHEGYQTYVGGNIGTPLLSRLDEITADDMVVLELSSFQLQSLHYSPEVAVITNITPNHLDYHLDMQEYIDAKTNIYKFQKENCRLVLNNDNDITNSLASSYEHEVDMFSRKAETTGAYVKDGAIYYHSKKILDTDQIKIKGVHNIENYMAAICAVYPFVSEQTILHVAQNFSGVEHRMEFVRKLDGVSFYNDSIGSSPTRTIAGLEAQPPGRIALIAGGYDKNLDFNKLADKIWQRVSALVLIGATAEKIKAEVEARANPKKKLPIMIANDMENAVKLAFAFAKGMLGENHTASVILSPACASFDMYKNFEERGNHFKSIVN
ncbi:MAG: UDP-N-acetylmuramoyl-L-alanine--D-glutamate ligase, partial [Clostridia bacterium]|nr:UDP-N-acetylmuramoyl-L-alanine--D-glutamate ligase [Clostridia bacterium]